MVKKVILSIDTSCDDTSVAVTQGVTVLSNVIASQVQLHKQYGGVFPTVAKQAHKENIDPSVHAALKKARVDWDQIDAIAVTQGPGLAPALEVGINKAKKLSRKYKKPLIAVNHIEGHMLSALAERNQKPITHNQKQTVILEGAKRPIESGSSILSLVISGGHTEFILIKDIGNYERIGWTIDDAAGECLDKVGRMLGLGYPAGSVIEKFAKKGDENRFEFPLPMTTSHDYNLSFSGLKTFARNKIEELESQNVLDQQAIYDFAASFQYAVFRHVVHKLNKVLKDYPDLGQIWLGGGVAANVKLREMMRQNQKVKNQKLRVPYSKSLCSDNAAMIGVAAYFKYLKKDFVKNLDELDRKPRWEID